MNRTFFLLMVMAFIVMAILGCSRSEKGEKVVLAKINNYNLTLQEFEERLALEFSLDREGEITNAAKKEFMEELIQKEILIQEAKKLKLDTKERFIRTIELYWEATLVRDLVQLKCEEIVKRIYVSEDEIQKRYNEIKQSDNQIPSLADMKNDIINEVREKKKTAILREWIGNLRKGADIKIDYSLLD